MGGTQSAKTQSIETKHWVNVRIYEQTPKMQNNTDHYIIEEEGAVIHGSSQSAPTDITKGIEAYTGYPIRRIPAFDSRGHQLLVIRTRSGKFYAVPAPDFFSRCSGTCLMLGDKSHPPIQYSLQIGDMLHFGSVGLIVTEIHTGEPEGHQVISTNHTQFLYDANIQLFQSQLNHDGDIAITCSAERYDRSKQCYMCFESEFTTNNPLISACQCRGDTAYVHLECVRKWHSTNFNDKTCIVTNPTRERNPICTVCKTVYKSLIILNDGQKQCLFNQQVKPPFVCFTVVTRHDNAEHLFNSKYQLSFANQFTQPGIPRLYIGRSTECDLILDYRTVSGWHGTIKFQNNQFIYEDLRSSNGTLLYIRHPIELPLNSCRTFRLGRTLVSLSHKSTEQKANINQTDENNIQQDNNNNMNNFVLHDVNQTHTDNDDDLTYLMELTKWPSPSTFKNFSKQPTSSFSRAVLHTNENIKSRFVFEHTKPDENRFAFRTLDQTPIMNERIEWNQNNGNNENDNDDQSKENTVMITSNHLQIPTVQQNHIQSNSSLTNQNDFLSTQTNLVFGQIDRNC